MLVAYSLNHNMLKLTGAKRREWGHYQYELYQPSSHFYLFPHSLRLAPVTKKCYHSQRITVHILSIY